MLKRIFIICLSLLILIGSQTGAFANAVNSLPEKVLLDLQGFGIISGDETGALNLDNKVTRAEFSKIVAVMIGVDHEAGFQSRFVDVDASHWAASYINALAAYGLVSGAGENIFNPDGSIIYEQAVKVLVTALGYEELAQREGGWPDGYLNIGIKLKLGDKVTANKGEELLRRDVFMMIYNCLDVKLPEMIISKDGGYTISDTTYRDKLNGTYETGVRKMTGIVSANYDSYISAPNKNIEPNQVEFCGSLVDIGSTNLYDLLGQEVSVYLYYDTWFRGYRATSAMATVNNEVIKIDLHDIESYTQAAVSFIQNKKKETYALNNPIFVLNGVPTAFTELDGKLINGTMTLISNDGLSGIDVVIIDSYINGTTEKVNEEHGYITFKGQGPLNHKKVYASSDYTDDNYARICDEESKLTSLANIGNDSIVSLFFDKNGALKRVQKGRGTVIGTVDSVNSDLGIATIDSKEYNIDAGIDLSEFLGKYVEAKLDCNYVIADIEQVQDKHTYGVIVAVGAKKGLSNRSEVKMLIPNALSEKEEENEDPTADITKALVARNSEVAVISVAENLKINGIRYKGSDILAAINRELINSGKGYIVVEYEMNQDGEIRSLKTPEEIGTMTTKTYNSDEKTFGKTLEGGAFGISDSTLSICVPRNEISSDDDYLAYIAMTNDRSYRVSAFEYNEDTYCADLIVINETMTYETSGSITKASKAALVKGCRYITDKDAVQITLVTKDGEKEFFASDHTTSTADFSKLKNGDLIYYSEDMEGKLDGYSLISKGRPVPETGTYPGDSTTYIGYVSDMNYNKVSNNLNCWVDVLKIVDSNGNINTFEIRKNSAPPIFIYDSENKECILATTEDLLRNCQRVVVAASGQNVRAVMLIV